MTPDTRISRLRLLPAAVFVAACAAVAAYAVEIPLDRAAKTIPAANDAGTAVAYVDVQKVIDRHPMTAQLKKEFREETEKRRAELQKMQASINDLQNVIVSSTAYVATLRQQKDARRPAVSASTATVASPAPESSLKEAESSLDAMKKDLEDRKKQLQARAAADRSELAALEEKQTASVMADIYALLKKTAEEKDIAVIFDRSDILYGREVRDLTPVIIERLNAQKQ